MLAYCTGLTTTNWVITKNTNVVVFLRMSSIFFH